MRRQLMSWSVFACAAVVTLVAVLHAAGPAEAQSRAVQLGGHPTLDACGSIGVPTGLNPRGDNFLAVRAGPSSRTAMLDKLRPNEAFFICEQRGAWLGIVYSRREGPDCGANVPVPRRKAYDGPCRSGWVFRRFVRLLAG